MDIIDSEEQFENNPISFPDDQTFMVIVGQNNSGKSTILRSILKTLGNDAFRIDVNRTVLQGEGALDKNYESNYPGYLSTINGANSDNQQRPTQALQDFFLLNDPERQPIIDWYNNYFPNRLYEERENPENSASPKLLKVDGYPITQQGSGMRATIEIFIKLFDPKIKVLCIDEPELGLEPYLQKFLHRSLKEKARPDKKIVLATHSHHFLDMDCVSNNYSAERNSAGKIHLSQVTDLKEVIFRLLGNTLSSFLLPEKVLVLEGPSDFTFVKRALDLFGKEGYAVHGSGGIGNISYATNSISQFLRFNDESLSVYKDKMFVIVDKPTKDTMVREWKILLDDPDQQRICVLPKNGIEYYYPEEILQSIFNTDASREAIIDAYIAAKPTGFNNIEISKTKLARNVAETLQVTHLVDDTNELFNFLQQLPQV